MGIAATLPASGRTAALPAFTVVAPWAVACPVAVPATTARLAGSITPRAYLRPLACPTRIAARRTPGSVTDGAFAIFAMQAILPSATAALLAIARSVALLVSTGTVALGTILARVITYIASVSRATALHALRSTLARVARSQYL